MYTRVLFTLYNILLLLTKLFIVLPFQREILKRHLFNNKQFFNEKITSLQCTIERTVNIIPHKHYSFLQIRTET